MSDFFGFFSLIHSSSYLPSGHDVVEVDDLHEGLDLNSLVDLGLAHGPDNLAGVPVDAGHCVGEEIYERAE